ncbi:hypothetical protein HmCmsJML168_01460 [Escherichia coli]|nr:hypothetical protein HmCmsJML168_01460 [Escherichia coli]CAA0316199.1 Uncharacterised protein [Klebsiella oxytoca]
MATEVGELCRQSNAEIFQRSRKGFIEQACRRPVNQQLTSSRDTAVKGFLNVSPALFKPATDAVTHSGYTGFERPPFAFDTVNQTVDKMATEVGELCRQSNAEIFQRSRKGFIEQACRRPVNQQLTSSHNAAVKGFLNVSPALFKPTTDSPPVAVDKVSCCRDSGDNETDGIHHQRSPNPENGTCSAHKTANEAARQNFAEFQSSAGQSAESSDKPA